MPYSDIEKRRKYHRAHYQRPGVKEARNAGRQRRRRANPDETHRRDRVAWLRKYGLTLSDYERIRTAQGNACVVCKKCRELHVDHDHLTGLVRGLLCGPCNRALGMLEDDKERISSLLTYLEETARIELAA